jgi:hypothetical protein
LAESKAGKHTLRRYLLFSALIQRVRNPARAVDRYLRQRPDLDENETRSWEAWRADFVPEFTPGRSIETATIKEGPL